ncbi:multiubiquitin domain-containing protein [Parasphingorhabdus sp.]|uniref:multiubiquitin domain-containing protein n=1 Tax=Parasphingorhabdus sp. TaxID=2709688 RepID=UPI002B26C4FB|nr:multiubiquitin domain-containing protein [Parasphingorhabdus sp.]|tara:strand:+ start:639 stop:1298 length:660 start_codon:yes stop_codon:yes gene_type:complete
MGAKEYQFEVDGVAYGTDDRVLDGRQIRDAAGMAPASDYVLIQFTDQVGRSVGLEDAIKLVKGGSAKFRAFQNDRIFTFTLNERGWEWGASKINELELREIAEIAEDDVLVLDGNRDKVIEPGEEIKFGPAGVEHIITERPQIIKIKLNGRWREVPPGQISYETLVDLADLTVQAGPNIYYTVTYRKGPRRNPEGSMQPGESVQIKNGMVFNVRATDKS